MSPGKQALTICSRVSVNFESKSFNLDTSPLCKRVLPIPNRISVDLRLEIEPISVFKLSKSICFTQVQKECSDSISGGIQLQSGFGIPTSTQRKYPAAAHATSFRAQLLGSRSDWTYREKAPFLGDGSTVPVTRSYIRNVLQKHFPQNGLILIVTFKQEEVVSVQCRSSLNGGLLILFMR